jgi:hypothetical protein
MRTIKTFLNAFIFLSLLIGVQTNAITPVEYLTKPDWYKNLYNAFLSAEIKADAELRKTMVINGMTEAEWLKKRAHTINAVQRVVSTDNATTVPYRMSMKPEDQAIKSLVPDILETALTWQAQILFSLGKVTLDFAKNSLDPIDTSTTNSNPPIITLSPESTFAGVRLKKTITGTLSYSISTNSDPAINYALSAGGHVYRTSDCLVGQPCANFPQLPISLSTYLLFLPVTGKGEYQYTDDIEYSFNGEVEVPTGIIYTTATVINSGEISGLTVGFSDIEKIISYLNTTGRCSLPFIFEFSRWSSTSSSRKTSPACSFRHATVTNADNTNTIINIYNKVPYFLGGIVRTYEINTHSFSPLITYSTNIQSMPFSKDQLDAKVSKNTLVAHLNNLLLRASQQSDYNGLSYSPSSPITENDINFPYVKLRDLLGATTTENGEVYISPDGKTQDPLVIQYVINNNCTGTNSCNNNGGDVDLTSPPADEPKLEPTPSARSILQPLLDLLPSYKITSISHVAGVCPTASFDTEFGEQGGSFYRTWTIDHHCNMFEDFRAAIESIFMVIFAFAAFRIVLKA